MAPEPNVYNHESDHGASQNAARLILIELTSRVSTIPLPYQDGDEQAALDSLLGLFANIRHILKSHKGCSKTTEIGLDLLNNVLRPFTAKWHRRSLNRLLASKDGSNAFRADLKNLQQSIRDKIAPLYDLTDDVECPDQSPGALPDTDFQKRVDDPLPFGVMDNREIEAPDGTSSDINRLERQEIQRIREQRAGTAYAGSATLDDVCGLAISGGGIRSATYSLGIVQALADKGILQQVDILSTVSGGGYTGSFVSRQLGSAHDKSAKSRFEIFRQKNRPDSDAVQRLRRRARYLDSGSTLGQLKLLCMYVFGLLLNWTVFGAGVAIVVVLASLIRLWLGDQAWLDSSVLIGWLTGLSGLLAALAFAIYIAQNFVSARRWQERALVLSLCIGLMAGGALMAAAVVGAYRFLHSQIDINQIDLMAVGTFVLAVAGVGANIFRSDAVAALGGLLTQIGLFAISILIPVLGITLAVVGYIWVTFPATGTPGDYGNLWLAIGACAVLVMLCGFALDINKTAPMEIYRQRLQNTFVALSDSEDTDALTALSETNKSRGAPYHLLNAVVNIPEGDDNALRERRGDFFVFSKFFVGSPATGYHATKHWEGANCALTLSHAVAASGAAVAPHMGRLTIGSVTALLTFLNIRLGLWLKAPGDAKAKPQRPGFWQFIQEMTGWGMKPKAPWLYVTDGGHLENCGAYELLRRQTKFIICAEGGADAPGDHRHLINLIRQAKIDFGIDIDADLTNIAPRRKGGFNVAHACLCHIKYPERKAPDGTIKPGGDGFMLYLPASLTGDESHVVAQYARTNPAFPHKRMIDQFFDEEQVEAHRQLGVHIVDGLFHQALGTSLSDDQSHDHDHDEPMRVSQWFKALAGHLLPRPLDYDRYQHDENNGNGNGNGNGNNDGKAGKDGSHKAG